MTKPGIVVLTIICLLALVVIAGTVIAPWIGTSSKLGEQELLSIANNSASSKEAAGKGKSSPGEPVVVECPQLMKKEDVDQCLQDARDKVVAMNKEGRRFGLKPVSTEPVTGERCVTVPEAEGAGQMEFYPNGYGSWNGKEKRFVFCQKQAPDVGFRIEIEDADHINVVISKPAIRLSIERPEAGGTFERVGAWDRVKNSDEVFETAMHYYSKVD